MYKGKDTQRIKRLNSGQKKSPRRRYRGLRKTYHAIKWKIMSHK